MTDNIAAALNEVFISANESDSNLEPANVVDGLFAIARGLHHVAHSIDRLGVNGADTSMGAIELLALEVSKLAKR